MMTDIPACRKDFLLLDETVYLDNAATSQKPESVIEAVSRYYRTGNANIHRGTYPLSVSSSDLYDHARGTAAEWIGADVSEVIFTKGTTEGINLLAYALTKQVGAGDSIVVTELEHSSNWYPWKELALRSRAEFAAVPVDENGWLCIEDVLSKINSRTRLVAITGMSNVTGQKPDIRRVIKAAHEVGAAVMVDATQLIVHQRINVKELDCDWLCFSGHKIYGPMGTGVLYGKKELIEQLPPFLFGGDMVGRDMRYVDGRQRFEAGTQNIAGAVGLEAALDYLKDQNFDELLEYEHSLGRYLHEGLESIPDLHFWSAEKDSAIQTFSIDHVNGYDAGTYLGRKNICVRTGGMCAYPLVNRIHNDSLIRISLAFYNSREEADQLVKQVRQLTKVFRYG